MNGEPEHFSLVSASDAMKVCYRHVESAYEYRLSPEFMRYPFFEFNEFLGPMAKGELIIVAGRPGMRQEAWLSGMMSLAEMRGEFKPVVLLSSMSRTSHQASMHLLLSSSNIPPGMAEEGRLGMENWRSLAKRSEEIAESGLFIADGGVQSLETIQAQCHNLVQSEGRLDFILIDKLQFLKEWTGSVKAREQLITEMKQLASEFDAPVMVMSDIKPSIDLRRDRSPRLADIDAPTVFESVADTVICLHKEPVTASATVDDSSMIKTYVLKHRHFTGRIDLDYDWKVDRIFRMNDFMQS